MSNLVNAVEQFKLEFERVEQSQNGSGSGYFQPLRQHAFQSFEKLGFPTPKNEDWKYTNLAPLARQSLKVGSVETDDTISLKDCKPFLIESVSDHRVVLVNGVVSEELSIPPTGGNGVTAVSIASLQRDAGSLTAQVFQKYFASIANAESNIIEALNTAFVRDGMCIFVAKNRAVSEPLHILNVVTDAASSCMISPRVLVVAEPGSEVTVIESYVGLTSNPYLTTSVAEWFVGENASVNHCRIQQEGGEAYHLASTTVQQKQDSRFRTCSITTGGKLSRHEIRPRLEGEGVYSELHGLTVLDGEQHADNFLVVDHKEPHGESSELFKGIYDGTSRGVFSGTIIVQPDAQKTNAFQSNQSLLLSDTASAESRPQLKIWADDVKCSHGATVGQIDDEAMYYLRSRGISRERAFRMLVKAFAGEVLSSISPEPLAGYIDSLVSSKLQ